MFRHSLALAIMLTLSGPLMVSGAAEERLSLTPPEPIPFPFMCVVGEAERVTTTISIEPLQELVANPHIEGYAIVLDFNGSKETFSFPTLTEESASLLISATDLTASFPVVWAVESWLVSDNAPTIRVHMLLSMSPLGCARVFLPLPDRAA